MKLIRPVLLASMIAEMVGAHAATGLKCTLTDGRILHEQKTCLGVGAIREEDEVRTPKEAEAEALAKRQAQQAAQEAQEEASRPRIGMTTDEADRLPWPWGHPSRVNRTTNARGEREQWVYADINGMGIQYLYFDNGILTSIQQ